MDEPLQLQKEVSTRSIMIYMTSNDFLQMHATVGMAALRLGPIDLIEIERQALMLLTVVLSHGGRDGSMLGQPSM